MSFINTQRIFAASLVAAASIAGCYHDSETPIGKPNADTTATKSEPGVAKSQLGPKRAVKKMKSVRVVVPTHSPKESGPRWDPKGIQDFELVERSGRKIRRADLLGKPFVASFIFTSCRGPCGRITKEMYELQEWMKQENIDVRLVTLSVDPKRDTPDVLKRYAEVMGADGDRWWFLTGDQSVIFSLIRKSFLEMVFENQGAKRLPGYEIAHTTGLMLVNKSGRVIGEYNARSRKPLNDLRRRLSAWKRTGEFPEEEKEPKNTDPRKQPSTSSASGGNDAKR